jgi:bla regulator protein BlaR1
MASLAASFGQVGRPLMDQTGGGGRFDFSLEYAPESNRPPTPGADVPDPPAGPTFLEALREQLGLKPESTKAPLQILVVDHVERPSEN